VVYGQKATGQKATKNATLGQKVTRTKGHQTKALVINSARLRGPPKTLSALSTTVLHCDLNSPLGLRMSDTENHWLGEAP